MPANVGAAAEVPPIETGRPPRKTRKKSAWAATSGMACTNGRQDVSQVCHFHA